MANGYIDRLELKVLICMLVAKKGFCCVIPFFVFSLIVPVLLGPVGLVVLGLW